MWRWWTCAARARRWRRARRRRRRRRARGGRARPRRGATRPRSGAPSRTPGNYYTTLLVLLTAAIHIYFFIFYFCVQFIKSKVKDNTIVDNITEIFIINSNKKDISDKSKNYENAIKTFCLIAWKYSRNAEIKVI